jgi:hypothetical protein
MSLLHIENVAVGAIVETLTDAGIPTGNLYKIVGESGVWPSCIKARKAFTNDPALLYRRGACRVLPDCEYADCF